MKRILYVFSIVFILLTSVSGFILTTTPGLYVSLKLVNLFSPGNIKLHHGAGTLMKELQFSELDYVEGNVHVKLTDGHLRWNLNTLLRGKLPLSLSINKLLVIIKASPHVHVPTLKPPFKLIINQLTINEIEIQHQGTTRFFHHFKLKSSINKQRWHVSELKTITKTHHLSFTGNGQSQAPYPLAATLKLKSVSKASENLEGNIQVQGDLALYQWQGEFSGFVQGNIHGTLKNGTHLESDVQWYDTKGRMNASNTFASTQGHVHIKGTLFDDFMITADTHIKSPTEADLKVTAHIKDHQAHLNSILQLTKSQLKTTITAKGTFYDAQNGNLNLTINPGSYQLTQDNPNPALDFKGGDLAINLKSSVLDVKGALMIDPQKIVNVTLHIPHFQLDAVKSSSKNIEGKLNLRINDLNFLQNYSEAVDNLQGQLQMTLTAQGSLDKPQIKGEILLNNAHFSVPKSGLNIETIEAKLQSNNHHWQAQGSLISGGHALVLKGLGDFYPAFNGKLTLSGENFPAMKTPNYTINLSPQLVANFNPKVFNLTGNILVPSAQFKPQVFNDTINLSEDVVFVKKTNTQASNPFNINMDILVKTGSDVRLDVKGLQGFLDGAIRLQQTPKNPISAAGELRIRKGRYQAYGQDLVIDHGQLLFTGGSFDNPELHIRAIRRFSNATTDFSNSNQVLDFRASNIDTVDMGSHTTVGIEVSGRLNASKIKLFSIPPTLSQADILSLLLLGKPASQASKAGGQLLLAAISSMNLDSGTKGLQLLSQLKQSLGIDINLQNNPSRPTSNQTGESTAFVVGKSLTKRIYLSYNIGLLQNDSNVLTLKYLLNKFFSIQVTSSDTGNGLDLLYNGHS